MKNKQLAIIVILNFFILTLSFCNSAEHQPTDTASPILKLSVVSDSLVLLNALAKPGDLVLRLGDDFLSYQIRFMSHQDQSYSHVGVVVNKDGHNLVCHIFPDTNGADTVRYEPIDSFVNPSNTKTCALYRYNFSPAEIAAFSSALDSFAKSKVHFDKRYELATKDVYCSEMIYKSMKKATSNRISPKVSVPPANMVALLMKYFAKEKPKKETLANWKFIAIDDLYLMPECRKIVSINLQPSANQ